METALPAVNGSTNTVVVVRVRPFGRKEQMTTACAEALNDGRSLIARRDERRGGQYLQSQQATETSYVFDGTFGPATSQRDVYEQTTKPHVATLARGQIPALTVVAYGSTGAGKTHTMMGDRERRGVIPRAVGDLFAQLPQGTTARVSYLEVYNERVFDLLGADRSKPLKVCEDKRLGVVRALNLEEAPCATAASVLELLSRGNENRKTEATGANDASSRSHAVLQIKIGERALTLVDLAGSERASATGNRGLRLAEGAHINRSLLALANCINALSCPLAPWPKFRDSKLTLILKSSLESSQVRLVVVACVVPSMNSVDDTMNTLKYAQRAKELPKRARKSSVDRRASLGGMQPQRPARRQSTFGDEPSRSAAPAPKRRRASVAAPSRPFRRASSAEPRPARPSSAENRRESISAVDAARKYAAEVMMEHARTAEEIQQKLAEAAAPAPAVVPEAPVPPREKPLRKRRGSIGAPVGIAARVKKRRASTVAAPAPAPAEPAPAKKRRGSTAATSPEGPPPDVFRSASQLARTGALPPAAAPAPVKQRAAPAPAKEPAAWRAQSDELREAMQARRAAKTAPPPAPSVAPPAAPQRPSDDAFRPVSQLARTGALPAVAPPPAPPVAVREMPLAAVREASPVAVREAPAKRSIREMKAAIIAAGLGTEDLVERLHVEERYQEALRLLATEKEPEESQPSGASPVVVREVPSAPPGEVFRAAPQLVRTDDFELAPSLAPAMAVDRWNNPVAPPPAGTDRWLNPVAPPPAGPDRWLDVDKEPRAAAPMAVDEEEVVAGAARAFAPVAELARTGVVVSRPPRAAAASASASARSPLAERIKALAPVAERVAPPPPPTQALSPDLAATTSGAREKRAKRDVGALQERLAAAEARAAAWKDAATDAEKVASTLAAALREEWKDAAPGKWDALRGDFATFRARFAQHVAAADACLPPSPRPLGEASNIRA